jgi:hypothetical protein
MPADVPISDESFLRLHAAGWSISAAAYVERGSDDLVWLVTGTNGVKSIRAEGPTRDEAWWAPVGQEAAVVMLGARQKSPATRLFFLIAQT